MAMDAPRELLEALRWQIELGADEALEETPRDRLVAPRQAPASGPRQAAAPAAHPGPVPHTATIVPAGPRQGAPIPAPPLPAARDAAALAEAARNLAELRAAIAGFEGCALRATAANLVFAEGDPEAGLLLIGDAPSDEDDRAGRPFAGPDGAYLDRMLASIGLDRSRLLLTRMIPWRPPGSRPPSVAERAACLPFLHRLIALARPRRILLLGPLVAQDLLAGVAGRRPKRGVWYDLPLPGAPGGETVPVLSGPDPVVLVRNPGTARRQAWADLRMLRRSMDGDITKS